MWTYIEVTHFTGKSDAKTESFFQLLDMQLSRTANLPLDFLYFPPQTKDLGDRIREIFLEYEVFSRWRNLVMRLDYVKHTEDPDDLLSSILEGLCNLKSLTVIYRSYSSVSQTLWSITRDRSTTLRGLTFDAFDIHLDAPSPWIMPPVTYEMISRIYGIKMDHTSSVVLPNISGSRVESAFLPSHITKIECEQRHYHPFPHVEHYILTHCYFRPGILPSLGSLVILTTSELILEHSCQITLASLREIPFTGIRLEPETAIFAPVLQRLHIREPSAPENIFSRQRVSTFTGEAFAAYGFGLIPSEVLLLDDYFNAETVMPLLWRCTNVKSISLTFEADREALKVLEYIVEGDRLGQNSLLLASRVVAAYDSPFELKIKSLRNQGYVIRFKSRATEIVKKRNESGGNLKIYGKWEDDTDYILLA
ncbi:hypothetical protein M408DRAFT_27046 [Serendipita vermifera MAFF 305830]|uniref:F-box domain-containing protein n=1 Tax=Serendipita vermifera MAFF 305830 TaxID=933852 RepID=A0A0C2X4V9_SERVB|nr:hypothetical protein M408DRAFT_27046 [Serendipita vermifera MAFF 305830]